MLKSQSSSFTFDDDFINVVNDSSTFSITIKKACTEKRIDGSGNITDYTHVANDTYSIDWSTTQSILTFN